MLTKCDTGTLIEGKERPWRSIWFNNKFQSRRSGQSEFQLSFSTCFLLKYILFLLIKLWLVCIRSNRWGSWVPSNGLFFFSKERLHAGMLISPALIYVLPNKARQHHDRGRQLTWSNKRASRGEPTLINTYRQTGFPNKPALKQNLLLFIFIARLLDRLQLAPFINNNWIMTNQKTWNGKIKWPVIYHIVE